MARYFCNPAGIQRVTAITTAIVMLKSIASHLTIAALLLSGCGQAPETVVADLPAGVVRTVQEVAIQTGTPVTLADLSIEGMSCEMMCGSSIKKALAQLPGVSAAEITFIEGDELDHAIVTYDESQVTDADLVKAVQGLYDGQYKVLAVNVTKQVKAPGTASSNEAVEAKEEKAVSAYLPTDAILPSIVALLTRILRY